MSLSFNTKSPMLLSEALNRFDSRQHQDYAAFQPFVSAYYAEKGGKKAAGSLAQALVMILNNWGAGKRKAPECQTQAAIGKCLSDQAFYSQLVQLKAAAPLLGISDDQQRSIKPEAPFASLAAFDSCLLAVLNRIADDILVFEKNSRSAAYPMKVLLLLTGLMPALDSGVRKGLTQAGLAGFHAACSLDHPTDAKKICALPFYLGALIQRHKILIYSAIASSQHRNLAAEYGRFFDIILSMQSDAPALLVFTPQPDAQKWYNI